MLNILATLSERRKDCSISTKVRTPKPSKKRQALLTDVVKIQKLNKIWTVLDLHPLSPADKSQNTKTRQKTAAILTHVVKIQKFKKIRKVLDLNSLSPA